MNKAGNILFVLEGGDQGFAQIGEIEFRGRNCLQLHLLVIVLQIFEYFQGVLLFFFGLKHEPVAEAVQVLFIVIVGNIQVKIGRIKFLVDLILHQIRDLLIHDKILRLILL